MPRPLSALPKQLLDSPHRQEESFLNFGQFNESVSPVEFSRELILCVYDNTRRRDLLARIKAAVEGIHEQDLTDAPPAKFGTHCQTAEKGRRYHRIFRQPFRNLFGNCVKPYGELGKRIVARNGLAVGGRDERCRRALSRVLTGLLVQVGIKRFHAT